MSALANAARGETVLEIDGRPVRLCLTLGALAELETAFDATGLEQLAQRLASVSAADLLVIIAALSGEAGLTPAALSRARIDVRAATQAVGEAFRLALDAPG